MHPIPQEAFDWYDEYAHGLIDRRTFMSRLAGLTAAGFSMAALTTALGLIPLLLDAGADPAGTDAYGWTPLMRAVSSGYIGAVEAILASGGVGEKLPSRQNRHVGIGILTV